jgi:hypothetical protein
MVENIIYTLRNISFDVSMHQELLQNGYIEVIKKFVDLFLASARQQNDRGINEQ